MRVVVVGATGNVGTSVLTALAGHDEVDEVVGIARRAPQRTSPGVRFVEADIEVDSLANHCADAAAVILLAWKFQPTHDPVITWRTNVLGTERVLEAVAAADAGCLVYASSIGAYSPRPSDDRPVSEDWPTHSLPSAAYGREKSYVERLLDTFELLHPGVRVVRMRPAFMFQREAASEQRRIFGGRILPRSIFQPGRLPFLPVPPGLRVQALHTDDAAAAFVAAAIGDHRGAFNLAAEGVLDAAAIAGVLGTRAVTLPRPLVSTGLAAAWAAHLVPTEPGLVDLVLSLPVLDTTRARTELGWAPQRSALDAVTEAVRGIAIGAGGATPPLEPDD